MDKATRQTLHTLAAAQHGCFTLAQAAEAGASTADVRGLRQRGEVTMSQRGVYRFTAAPETWHAQAMAAVLAIGDKAVVSRRAALRLHGVGNEEAPVEVTVWSSALPRLTGDVIVHRTRKLDPADRTEVDGIPVTTGERTLIDVVAEMEWVEFTTTLDEAICRRVATRGRLYRRARELKNGRKDVAWILRLTGPEAEGYFWSWLERHAGDAFTAFHVPAPEWNVKLFDADGLIGVVDGLWRAARLIVELKGLRFHSLPGDFQRDKDKENRLVMAGYRQLSYTWQDVVERPEQMCAQVAAALRGCVE